MQKKTASIILWTGLFLAVLLGLIWQFFPLPDAQKRLNQLPMAGTNFSAIDVPLTPFEKDFFKNINILKRIYRIDQQVVFIYALDGTHNRHLVHDPSYCFRGSGWEIKTQSPFQIPGGSANLVKLEKDGNFRDTLYWFSDGKHNFKSPLRYWWDTTLRRLTFGKSGEEPLLIVVQPVETETLDWNKFIKDFPQIFTL